MKTCNTMMVSSISDIIGEAEGKRLYNGLTDELAVEEALAFIGEYQYKEAQLNRAIAYIRRRPVEHLELVVKKNPLRAVGRGEFTRTKSGKKVTVLQEMFSRAFTAYGKDTFGNITRSYIAAVGQPVGERRAEYNGRALRRKDSVKERINELMAESGWNDNEVDMEHLKVIKQDKDLSNKMRAISEYNKVTKRAGDEDKQVVVNIVKFHNDDTPSGSDQTKVVIDGEVVDDNPDI